MSTLQSQLDQVLALAEKATPGVWEADSVRNDGCDFAKAVNTEGRSLFDTLNSEVALIETEADDDYVSRWDSQGRADIEAAIAAVNFLREHGPAIRAAVGGEAWGHYIAGYMQGANDHAESQIDQLELRVIAEGAAIHDGYDLGASPPATVDVGALRKYIASLKQHADVGIAGAMANKIADELAALIGEKA